MTVAAVNDAPVADAGSIATDLGISVSGALSASDIDGDALSFSLASGPANGTATVAADGAYTYTPAAGYFGDDSFTFSVSDGAEASTAVMTVSVNPANLISGTAGDDEIVGDSGDDVLYGYAGDDMLRGAGGDDRYVFRLGDGGDTIQDEDTETATTTVWVKSGYWQSSRSADKWFDTSHWETTTVVVEADAGNDVLSFGPGVAIGDIALRRTGTDLVVGIKGPGDDVASFDALSDRITIANWSDTKDRVEALRFSDGAEVDISALSATLEALGDTGGVGLTGGGGRDWIVGGSGADLLSGGAGADVISGGTGDDIIQGGTGDDTISGGDGDDTAEYGGNFADYTVTLGTGGATVSGAEGTDVLTGVEHLAFADFSVFADGTNNAPVVTADSVTATEDTPVTIAVSGLLANDTDADGDALTIASVGDAVGGTVALDGSGDVVFTPTADFSGTARFDYTAADGQGGTATATVTVAVAAINDAPAATADAAATSEDTAVAISAAALLANDSDVDGDALGIASVGNAVGGAVALDGNGNVVFTPAADFSGTARFDYTASDGQGGTSTATVTVAVAAINDAPTTAADAAATSEDTSVTILASALLANDTDVEGDALSLTAVGNAVGGTVALDGSGDVVFTPTADFNGTASFIYTASDGTDGSTGTVTVAVSAVEDVPVVSAPVSLSMVEDGTLLITTPALLANAADGDGDALALGGLALTGGGTLADNGDGTWTYTPPNSFNGQVGLAYNVSDGTTTVAATATITVAEVNDPPVAAADTASTSEEAAVTILAASLLANDYDPEGDTLTLISVQGAVGGSVALIGGGDVVFTPVADFNGTASFSYTISDGTNTATQQVSVAVAAVNDAPVAGAGGLTTDLGVVLSGALSATDVDGDALTYSLSAGPANGTATVAADGAYTYTPIDGYSGADSFTFAVSDGAESSTAVVSITVNPANLVAGTAGDDQLTGTGADEVLYGYAGNDALLGADGDDRYVYRRGDGVDTIHDELTETTTTKVWVKSGYWSAGRNTDTWVDTSHWETVTTVVESDAGDDTLSFA